MITAIVQFKLPAPMSLEQAREAFLGTVPKYQKIEGLVRKYYLVSEDGMTGGGVYLFESQADADRLYTDDWKQGIAQRIGSEPSVTYFHTPVIIDNLVGEVVS